MKTKYVLMNDDRNIAIFDNLADAEEMYLSLLEEDGYNHCYRCIQEGFRFDLEDYYETYYRYFDKGVWNTFEGMYLYMISGQVFPIYHIEEVCYFE